MKIFHLALVLCFMASFQTTFAQDLNDTTAYRITTKDGNVYTGTVINREPGKILLKTANIGEITIVVSDISVIQAIDPNKFRKGGYWFENPQATRYLWTSNGYGLKKGEGYYQNVWVLFNQVAYGITDNISIGGGVLPLFFFGGASTPVWITPKVSIPIARDKVNLGVGALVGTVIGEDESGFGILYGITTFGSKDRNISIGLGWGYGGGETASTPTITVSGMLRTGPRGYILTENYFIDVGSETFGLLSLGGRRIIGKVGLDFGGFIPIDTDEVVFIPWLGVTIPFGKKPSAELIERN